MGPDPVLGEAGEEATGVCEGRAAALEATAVEAAATVGRAEMLLTVLWLRLLT